MCIRDRAYRGKYLSGGLLTAVFVALQIVSNHVQMSYYFLFVMLFMAVAFGVDAWQKKEMPQFLKATGVLLMAGILGVCINLSNLYHTYEYSKETMRGKSELVKPDSHNQTKSGLERDYITPVSYTHLLPLKSIINWFIITLVRLRGIWPKGVCRCGGSVPLPVSLLQDQA